MTTANVSVVASGFDSTAVHTAWSRGHILVPRLDLPSRSKSQEENPTNQNLTISSVGDLEPKTSYLWGSSATDCLSLDPKSMMAWSRGNWFWWFYEKAQERASHYVPLASEREEETVVRLEVAQIGLNKKVYLRIQQNDNYFQHIDNTDPLRLWWILQTSCILYSEEDSGSGHIRLRPQKKITRGIFMRDAMPPSLRIARWFKEMPNAKSLIFRPNIFCFSVPLFGSLWYWEFFITMSEREVDFCNVLVIFISLTNLHSA